MNMQKIAFAVMMATTLTACGGGGDTATPPPAPIPTPAPTPTPPPNQAPSAVNDSAATLNSGAITLNVLENDTDANGDTLTLTAVSPPALGTAEVSGTSIVYTPSGLALGTDSFTYTVSDGQAEAQATVTITNQQQLVLTGIAYDDPLANAEVTLSFGDDTFTATTDSEGRYAFDITVSENARSLQLRALGVGEQTHVELLSRMSGIEDIIALASEQEGRELSHNDFGFLKVSHISTALEAMYRDYMRSNPNGIEEAFLASVDAQNLIRLAGFIKVFADNPDFSLPEGVTTASLFVNSNDAPEMVMNSFLTENGFIDAQGIATSAYAAALAQAINETLSDATLLSRINESDVKGASIATFSRTAVNIVSGFNNSLIRFDNDGTGFDGATPFGYSVTNGAIEMQFSATSPLFTSALTCDFLAVFSPFLSATQVAEIRSVCDLPDFVNNPFAGIGIVSFARDKTRIGIIADRGTIKDAALFHEGVMTVSLHGRAPVEAQSTYTERKSYVYYDRTATPLIKTEDIVGNAYATEFYSSVVYELPVVDSPLFATIDNTYSGIQADVLAFGNSTVSTRLGGRDGVWQLDGASIVASFADSEAVITPIVNVGNYFIAVVETTMDNMPAGGYTTTLVKVNATLPSIDMTANRPVIWQSQLNHGLTASGNSFPQREDIFGWALNNDGSAENLAFRTVTSNSGTFTGLTRFATDELWHQDGLITNIDRVNVTPNSLRVARRRWEMLDNRDDGVAVMLEYRPFFQVVSGQTNASGVSSIPPRLNFYKKLDIQQAFPDVWAEFLARE